MVWMLERREPHDSADSASCRPVHAKGNARRIIARTADNPPARPIPPGRELRADDDDNPRWRPHVPEAIGRSSLIAGERCRVLACLYGQCADAVITVS